MKTKLLAPLVLMVLSLVMPARAETTGTSSPAISDSAAQSTPLPRGTKLGTRADEARYAQREAASPDAKKYRGGDVIIISASAVAIILLVIVILILI